MPGLTQSCSSSSYEMLWYSNMRSASPLVAFLNFMVAHAEHTGLGPCKHDCWPCL